MYEIIKIFYTYIKFIFYIDYYYSINENYETKFY